MRLVSGLAFLSAVAMVGCVGVVDSGGDEGVASDDSAVQSSELAPNGRGFLTKEAHAQGNAKPSSNGITYHGGPVMLGAIHAYYIWYGNWAGNSATSILTDRPRVAAGRGGVRRSSAALPQCAHAAGADPDRARGRGHRIRDPGTHARRRFPAAKP